ncbi:MAG: glycine--tRNA ligase [bacterium]
MVDLETIVGLAKRRGFVFPGSEIYGGLANSWDYGLLGVLLKNNIKRAWWDRFVRGRLDMVGIDSALIMNPKVWEASGHLAEFSDPLVECKSCHARVRADEVDLSAPCRECGQRSNFTEPAQFNMMFKTFVGPKEDAAAVAYLRPETAQGMFVNFAQVLNTSRKRIPFGIAQIGKAFRNEITPGNFIFRTREFEQMEIEYFVHPDAWQEYFGAWLKEMHAWTEFCGIARDRLHDCECKPENRSHYSSKTVDIEFDWPFGRKELYGIAYRGDHDLNLHARHSGKPMNYTDPITGEMYVPHVVEPTFGVDRTLLAMMFSAYHEEEVKGEKRVIMKFPAALAPYQVAVLPLSHKDELEKVSRPLAQELAGQFSCDYDVTQSIGKRYRRQDEIGTPYCITVDFESLEDKAVTIRDRDSMEQERISIGEVAERIKSKVQNPND